MRRSDIGARSPSRLAVFRTGDRVRHSIFAHCVPLFVAKLKRPVVGSATDAVGIATRAMSLTLEQIVEETRRWPEDVVAELIDRIVIAKHGGLDADHAGHWGKVAEDRLAESERDPSVLVSGQDVSARVRTIVGL
jgi:2',3'-cyclic-nucleotide 2'-phosphodiesterase (5'-nucleotidase family)